MRIGSKLAALAGGLLLTGMVAAGGVAYADDHDDRYDIPQVVLDDLGEMEVDFDLPRIAGLWYEEGEEGSGPIYYSWNRGATPEGSPVSDRDGYTDRAELQAHIDDVCANNGAGGGVAPIDNPYGPPYFLALTCADETESAVEESVLEESSTEESGVEDNSVTEDSGAGAG